MLEQRVKRRMNQFYTKVAEARGIVSSLPTYEDPLGSCSIQGLTEEDKKKAVENAANIEAADMMLKLRLFLLDEKI